MSIKVIKINTIKCMAALNNHQASKKKAAILKVLNTVNFNIVRYQYLLLIKVLTNTATHKHTDRS